MVNKEFIRDFQKEIIFGLGKANAEVLINAYESGVIPAEIFLASKKAIAWTIMEDPVVSINLSLGDEYGKLLRYIIKDKKLSKLDDELEIV